jgi:hypothetical protein
MDKRRLIIGLAVLFLITGTALACFTPGGFFNRRNEAVAYTPFGKISIGENESTPWPIIGYVLLALGGVGAVIAFAMKTPKGQ